MSMLFLAQETESDSDEDQWFKESHVDEQWIENSEFENDDGWDSTIEGDTTDVGFNIREGQAEYYVLGEKMEEEIFETPDSSWKRIKNADNQSSPDYSEIRTTGFWVNHIWDEDANQSVKVQWQKNFTTNLNMADYVITSASLEAYINATVQANDASGPANPGIDRPGDPGILSEDINIGDFAEYSILISDKDKNNEYIALNYRTDNGTLGEDAQADENYKDYLFDTKITSKYESDLIYYLEQALKQDNRHFSVTLCIEINCEDNIYSDQDNWDDLYILNFTLSFSYKKKINQFSSISLEYQGDEIEGKGGKIEVTDARLYFDYKVNSGFSHLSPNSALRILINDDLHDETINLVKGTAKFKEAEDKGFDVTELIPDDEDINVAIQLYLADNFELEGISTITIDNIELVISYDLYLPSEQAILFQVLLVIACVVGTGLLGYYLYYRMVLRYPKPVRKVRKYRRKLKSKKTPGVSIINRNDAFMEIYSKETSKTMNLLKSKQTKRVAPGEKKFNKSPQKLPDRLSEIKKKLKNKNFLFLFLILIGLFISPLLVNPNSNNYSIKTENRGKSLFMAQGFVTDVWFRESHEEQWIDNSDFDNLEGWRSLVVGDASDSDLYIGDSSANFLIEGETGKKEIIETPNNINWTHVQNPNDMAQPDFTSIKTGGCWANHEFHDPDDPNQTVRVQWERKVTMPVDMSEYIITSASLEIYVNATVYADDGDDHGIDRPGDSDVSSQMAVGDYAKYYVKISDLDKKRDYEAASYRTDSGTLGEDDQADVDGMDYLTDKKITTNDEDDLVFFLRQALLKDNRNFTITLGIKIFCEDNVPANDDDEWTDLYIKNISLTIDYEKKINRGTSNHWIYDADEIDDEGGEIEITEARLFFDYKITQLWPSISPNSEIRMMINNQEDNGKVKISTATTTLQEAKDEGFDVTELIPDDEEISVSIVLYIADEFVMANPIVISIDNVELDISYDIVLRSEQSFLFEVLFVVACCAVVCLLGYVTYYVRVLRYPKTVRKIRKFRKTLKKTQAPKTEIIGREEAFREHYKESLGKSTIMSKTKGKGSERISATTDKKIPEKISSDKINKLIGNPEN